MPTLTINDLNRLYHLAQLEPDNTQQEHLLRQINNIFDMIQEMQTINTDHVEPLFTPLSIAQTVELRLREDVVTYPASAQTRDLALRNAPANENGFFLVPKVIE
ncbi:MAG: Asp-tRNA(Asn)/Glu-tRNA(Gln) amidotransferase subunit GatC [Saezia sp.]